jgi:hypothetical protein
MPRGGAGRGQGRHRAIPDEWLRITIARQYIERVDISKEMHRRGFKRFSPPHREIVIAELMREFKTTHRTVVRCINEFRAAILAGNESLPPVLDIPESKIRRVKNQMAGFPHASHEIMEQVAREWLRFGEEDAKRRELSRRDWLWKRSRLLAGHF